MSRFKPRADSIVGITSEDHDEALRRYVAAGYRGKKVSHMGWCIDKDVPNVVELKKRKYLSTEVKMVPMDISGTIRYSALDAISDLAF